MSACWIPVFFIIMKVTCLNFVNFPHHIQVSHPLILVLWLCICICIHCNHLDHDPLRQVNQCWECWVFSLWNSISSMVILSVWHQWQKRHCAKCTSNETCLCQGALSHDHLLTETKADRTNGMHDIVIGFDSIRMCLSILANHMTQMFIITNGICASVHWWPRFEWKHIHIACGDSHMHQLQCNAPVKSTNSSGQMFIELWLFESCNGILNLQQSLHECCQSVAELLSFFHKPMTTSNDPTPNNKWCSNWIPTKQSQQWNSKNLFKMVKTHNQFCGDHSTSDA